jgi:ATP-binding protein involved in chromosome partitioning
MSPDVLRYLEPAGTRVRDPITNRSIWLAGMLRDGEIDGDTLRVRVHFAKGHSRDDRKRMLEALTLNLQGAGWQGQVDAQVYVEGVRRGAGNAKLGSDTPPPAKDPVPGMTGPGMQAHGGAVTKQPLNGVTHIIAVASGKGGVGKSTVATNLACALADQGHLVGLMDADIYGPSLPLMMNVKGQPVAGPDKRIQPLFAYGVKCMSIGFLVDDTQPIIWRGPMVMGVVRQFLQDVNWAPVDYLVIDLPPGTGDAQLTMIQNVPLAGAVIVTTPQEVALMDARRGVEMFRKLDVPVLGVVENMSWFELPDGSRAHPFGEGGGRRLAETLQVDLLGQVPLEQTVRVGGDMGAPAALNGDSPVQANFHELAEAVVAKLS